MSQSLTWGKMSWSENGLWADTHSGWHREYPRMAFFGDDYFSDNSNKSAKINSVVGDASAITVTCAEAHGIPFGGKFCIVGMDDELSGRYFTAKAGSTGSVLYADSSFDRTAVLTLVGRDPLVISMLGASGICPIIAQGGGNRQRMFAEYIISAQPGRTTIDGLARLEAEALAYNPDIVFIWLGARDIAVSGAIVSEIADNIRNMVITVLGARKLPILGTILRPNGNAAYLARTKDLNSEIRGFGKTFNIPVIDVEDLFLAKGTEYSNADFTRSYNIPRNHVAMPLVAEELIKRYFKRYVTGRNTLPVSDEASNIFTDVGFQTPGGITEAKVSGAKPAGAMFRAVGAGVESITSSVEPVPGYADLNAWCAEYHWVDSGALCDMSIERQIISPQPLGTDRNLFFEFLVKAAPNTPDSQVALNVSVRYTTTLNGISSTSEAYTLRSARCIKDWEKNGLYAYSMICPELASGTTIDSVSVYVRVTAVSGTGSCKVSLQQARVSIDHPNSGTINVNFQGFSNNIRSPLPSEDDIKRIAAHGIKNVRFPFKFERFFPNIGTTSVPAVDTSTIRQDQVDNLLIVLDRFHEQGIKIILDAHSYFVYDTDHDNKYTDDYAGSEYPLDQEPLREVFASAWGKLAETFKEHPAILGWGIMNEPKKMNQNQDWPYFAQQAVNAIRAVGSSHQIFVSGVKVGSCLYWLSDSAHMDIKDPLNNIVYEAHQYVGTGLDNENFTENYDVRGAYPMLGVDFVRPFVEWLKKTGNKGILGETAVPDDGDERWLELLENTLAYCRANEVPVYYWYFTWPGAHPLWPSYNNPDIGDAYESGSFITGLIPHYKDGEYVEKKQWRLLKKYNY